MREAQRALTAMVAEADRRGLARTSATVGELLEEWYSHAALGFSPKGALETRGIFWTGTCCRSWGNVQLSKLGAADLDRFYRQLREKGGGRSDHWRPGRSAAIWALLRLMPGESSSK